MVLVGCSILSSSSSNSKGGIGDAEICKRKALDTGQTTRTAVAPINSATNANQDKPDTCLLTWVITHSVSSPLASVVSTPISFSRSTVLYLHTVSAPASDRIHQPNPHYRIARCRASHPQRNLLLLAIQLSLISNNPRAPSRACPPHGLPTHSNYDEHPQGRTQAGCARARFTFSQLPFTTLLFNQQPLSVVVARLHSPFISQHHP